MAWPLDDYRVISMDCYGTLIDWETGIWNAFQPLLGANEGVSPRPLEKPEVLAAFAELEAAQQAAEPTMLYPEVLRAVHQQFAQRFDLVTADRLDDAFGWSVPDWPAFPDAPEALERLDEHYELVILSNVDRTSFAASNAKLDITFDAIFTAEDVGSYKPDLGNFHHMLTALGEHGHSPATDILHVAQSVFHDHMPAAQVGLDRVWIDRQRLSDDGDWGATAHVSDVPEADFTYYSMAEFADAVDLAFAEKN